jgi:hypothetical protein
LTIDNAQKQLTIDNAQLTIKMQRQINTQLKITLNSQLSTLNF